jgi:hypothetical protein
MKPIYYEIRRFVLRVLAALATLTVGMSFVLAGNANAGPQGTIVIKNPVVVVSPVAVAPAAVPVATPVVAPAVAPVAVPVATPVAVPVVVPVAVPVVTPFFSPFFSPFFNPFFGFDVFD